MSTQAPSHPTPVAAGFTVDERPTAPVSAAEAQPTLDTLPLLDHRARAKTVQPGLASSGYYLALQEGEEHWLVPLESDITHIGRGVGCDLRFEHQQISRNHAIIVRHGRYARLLDNRSANGTFLNGRQIVATNIADGDVIRFGPVAVQYLIVR